MTCQHTMTLGVYLLGALDPMERSQFESHLSHCDTCRGELVRLAPLPGLLNQITRDDFAEEGQQEGWEGREGAVATRVPLQSQPVTEPVPLPFPPLLPVTHDAPESHVPVRKKRYWQVAAAAAVVVLLAVGGIFGWQAIREPVRPAGVTWSATTQDGSAHADARLIDHEWGTEIQVKVEGLAPGQRCYLVVYDHYGKHETAGWWGTDHDPTAEIPASTSIARSKIERLEFKLDKETVAVTIPAPE
jgi:anti-sigma factor RsiW